MGHGRNLLRWLALVAITSLLAPRASAAVLPFYEQLYEDGKRALELRQQETAARHLELACFGMLDDANRLAECLAYLAVAQARTADAEGFRNTFDRIREVELRFKAFSRLALTEALRSELEEQFAQSAPYETLRDLPTYAGSIQRDLEAEILSLPLEERRPKLLKLLDAQPDNLSWRILMAEVDLGTEDFAAAVREANHVLSNDTELLKAFCIRGQARAALNQCEGALVDLYTCDESHRLEVLNRLKIRCHLSLGQLDSAEALVPFLPRREQQKQLKLIESQRPTPTDIEQLN